MKVLSNKIDTILKDINTIQHIFFLHGRDYEPKEIIASKIIATLNCSYFISINLELFYNDQDVLYNELFNTDLLCQSKMIKIDGIDAKFQNHLNYIDAAALHETNVFLILIASDTVLASSKIVKQCNDSPNIISIGCYKPSEADIIRSISELMSYHNFEYKDDVPRYMASKIDCNELLLRAEIDKLIMYVGDKKIISIPDVDAICNDYHSEAIGILIDSIMENSNPGRSIFYLNIVIQTGVQIITILRLLLAHIQKLYTVAVRLIDKADIDSEILSVKLFFKRAQSFKKQLSKHNIDNLCKLMQRVIDIESMSKEYAQLGEVILKHMIIDEYHKSNISRIT